MADNFVGEIRLFAGNFAPTGWAMCNGQLLSISQNTALFSLIGTYYGGNGTSTFALPNLQGAIPIAQGQGPGLSDRVIGGTGGSAQVTLTEAQIPAHTHTVLASATAGTTPSPVDATWAEVRGESYGTVTSQHMSAAALTSTGGSGPHNNLPPYLALNYIIALLGIFPARS